MCVLDIYIYSLLAVENSLEEKLWKLIIKRKTQRSVQVPKKIEISKNEDAENSLEFSKCKCECLFSLSARQCVRLFV